MIFVKKFRWTLGGQYLQKQFIKNANVDYVSNLLTFEIYEMVPDGEEGIENISWADKINEQIDEVLTLTTYDACGTELYNCIFSQLSRVAHTSDFDYGSSDEATQKITVRYEHFKRNVLTVPKKLNH